MQQAYDTLLVSVFTHYIKYEYLNNVRNGLESYIFIVAQLFWGCQADF